MKPIRITQHDRVLAEEVITSLKSPDKAVWKIRVPRPSPGSAFWSRQGGPVTRLRILGVANEWLIVRRPSGLLGAILWRDGQYYFNCLRSKSSRQVTRISRGLYIERGPWHNKSNTLDTTWWNFLKLKFWAWVYRPQDNYAHTAPYKSGDRRKRGKDAHIDMLVRSLELTTDPHAKAVLEARIEAVRQRFDKWERRVTNPP